MRKLGYKGHHEVVDSSCWLPQRRQRIYMLFVRQGCGEPKDVFLVLNQTKPTVPPKIGQFLEKIQPKHVEKECHPKFLKPMVRNHHKVTKWHQKTKLYVKNLGLKQDLVIACQQRLLDFSSFHSLPARCQYSLILHYARLIQWRKVNPFQEVCFLDLSQCVSRTPTGLGLVPRLTPRGKLWATHLNRLLTATEHARLQGLSMHEIPSMATASDALLRDLVGNAFTLPVMVGIWLGVLTKVQISS